MKKEANFLTYSCITKYDIVDKNIFFAAIYKLFERQTY